MYGSPEARTCPAWCCVQNSHALRIRETSSLGRLACTWRRSSLNLRFNESCECWPRALFGAGRTIPAVPPDSAEIGLVEIVVSAAEGSIRDPSAGTVCRTVAMIHYRPFTLPECCKGARRTRVRFGPRCDFLKRLLPLPAQRTGPIAHRQAHREARPRDNSLAACPSSRIRAILL